MLIFVKECTESLEIQLWFFAFSIVWQHLNVSTAKLNYPAASYSFTFKTQTWQRYQFSNPSSPFVLSLARTVIAHAQWIESINNDIRSKPEKWERKRERKRETGRERVTQEGRGWGETRGKHWTLVSHMLLFVGLNNISHSLCVWLHSAGNQVALYNNEISQIQSNYVSCMQHLVKDYKD